MLPQKVETSRPLTPREIRELSSATQPDGGADVF
jgi:hypothetical protein